MLTLCGPSERPLIGNRYARSVEGRTPKQLSGVEIEGRDHDLGADGPFASREKLDRVDALNSVAGSVLRSRSSRCLS